jgi:hypothetical protein
MKRILAVALVLSFATVAMAAPALQYNVVYGGSADATWTPIADQFTQAVDDQLVPIAGYNPTSIHTFYVYGSATGLAAGENVQLVVSDILASAGVVDQFSLIEGATYDPAGPVTSAPVFTHADGGVAGDNLGITSTVATAAMALQPLEGGGMGTYDWLGTLYVTWNGVGQATLSVGPSTGSAWVTNLSGTANPQPAGSSVGDVISFGAIPEPITMTLLGIGGLLLRRRR